MTATSHRAKSRRLAAPALLQLQASEASSGSFVPNDAQCRWTRNRRALTAPWQITRSEHTLNLTHHHTREALARSHLQQPSNQQPSRALPRRSNSCSSRPQNRQCYLGKGALRILLNPRNQLPGDRRTTSSPSKPPNPASSTASTHPAAAAVRPHHTSPSVTAPPSAPPACWFPAR